MKKIEAGSEIDSYCTKCKLDLGHRIIAMDGEKAKRVECLTCKGHHNYRIPKAEKAEKAAKAKKKKTVTKKKAVVKKTTRRPAAGTKAARVLAELELHQQWEGAVSGRGPGDFTKYAISSVLALGELVRHKKFGDGVVSDLFEGGKVEVIFEAGTKRLVHGR